MIKKQKVRWYQKLSTKCSLIAVLIIILKLFLIYILYVLIINGPESKETPKVSLVKFNIGISPTVIYYTYKEDGFEKKK